MGRKYFVVIPLNPQTFTIVEPNILTYNSNHVVQVHRPALCLESGNGHNDSSTVTMSLTLEASYFHFDCSALTNLAFGAISDIPHVRAQARSNILPLTMTRLGGATERLMLSKWAGPELTSPGALLDLGHCSLDFIYTPNNTSTINSLFDVKSMIMFGDYFMQPVGQWRSITPTGKIGDNLHSTEKRAEVNKMFRRHRFLLRTQSLERNNSGTNRARTVTSEKYNEKHKIGGIRAVAFYPATYKVNELHDFVEETPLIQS